MELPVVLQRKLQSHKVNYINCIVVYKVLNSSYQVYDHM